MEGKSVLFRRRRALPLAEVEMEKITKVPREGAVNPDAPKSIYGVLYVTPMFLKDEYKQNLFCPKSAVVRRRLPAGRQGGPA